MLIVYWALADDSVAASVCAAIEWGVGLACDQPYLCYVNLCMSGNMHAVTPHLASQAQQQHDQVGDSCQLAKAGASMRVVMPMSRHELHG